MKVAELQNLISSSFLLGSEKPGLQKLWLGTRFQYLQMHWFTETKVVLVLKYWVTVQNYS